MSKLKEVKQLGQAIWLDYIRRSFITSGELQALIDSGLQGVTSNPSIFEKAIAGSVDYDLDLMKLVDAGQSESEIYENLVIADIVMAADQLLPVYNATQTLDGYVSLEVSPDLAHDTEQIIQQAKRLFTALDRPNVMIKVAATAAGIPAVAELIACGINVNVTLIFRMQNYKAVAESYISGLEKLAQNGPSIRGGHPVDKIASVASFFVSRVDTAVDKELEKKGNTELLGKIAIANAKVAYDEFNQIFSSTRWQDLAAKGAHVQRPLWASTGTKNPTYPDTLYVDQLIGANTVNTVPPATLNSFIDHGQVQETLSKNIDHARSQLQKLAHLGINLDAITSQLQADGVKAFAKSFESLMVSITEKKDRIMAQKKDFVFQLGDLQGQVDEAIETISEGKIISRIWKHDHTVWKDGPAEITNRLGWLHSPEVMSDSVPHITDFVNTIRSEGFTHALLLGMGGSSLAPEVFRYTFGVNPGFLDLAVLDSTDPGAVLEKEKSLNPRNTLYVVSTKSGGTVETISFMKYFYNRVLAVAGEEYVGKHFIAITDPGSGLESMAKALKFRKIFLNDPNIGGRYSALSYFGLVPAALIGMDIVRLLDRAARMACNCEACNCPVKGNNTCAWLGSALGEMAKIGRDKVTLIASPEITYFGAWVEQLLAESTGKEGEGILPVDGETLTMPETYASDRLFIYFRLEGDDKYDDHIQTLVTLGHPVIQLNLRDLYDLGGEFFRWEFATVIAGAMLKINPFDQPNVEAAKVVARQMVVTYQQQGELPSLQPTLEDEGIKVYSDIEATGLREILRLFFNKAKADKDTVKGRSYVALQAYLKPTPETNMALQDLRSRIQSQFGLATTAGYGPRFLHSTGQLHKGDSGNGLFIQFIASMPQDVPIPSEAGKDKSSITFGILKNAQALGDRQALLDAGRNVISFDLGNEIIAGIERIMDVL